MIAEKTVAEIAFMQYKLMWRDGSYVRSMTVQKTKIWFVIGMNGM